MLVKKYFSTLQTGYISDTKPKKKNPVFQGKNKLSSGLRNFTIKVPDDFFIQEQLLIEHQTVHKIFLANYLLNITDQLHTIILVGYFTYIVF